jgi:hypothetical protein
MFPEREQNIPSQRLAAPLKANTHICQKPTIESR